MMALAGSLLLPGLCFALGAPGVAVPVHALQHSCIDPRYPALAGPWAVGCGPDGLVDRAVNLVSGALVELPTSGRSPALADGALLFVDPRGSRLVRLSEPGAPVVEQTRFPVPLVAPPAYDGEHLALLAEDHVQVGAPDQRTSRRWDANPSGWYPPALAWPWVAWVEDAGADGEDVRAVNTARAEAPLSLARGPGYERHVVGSGPFLAWVEEDAVIILDTRDGARHAIPAEAGFSAPLSLWQDIVCWERRDGRDLDIRCSDGLVAEGPGHQEAPSRHDRWLLYRAEGQVWLKTAP